MLIDELAKEYVKNLKNEEKRKKQERRLTNGKKLEWIILKNQQKTDGERLEKKG